MKKSLGLVFLAFSMLAPAVSHAGGTWTASGTISSLNCSGGEVALEGVNTDNNNWIFDITVVCRTGTPQHVAIAGSWNAAGGGAVSGFGTGGLLINGLGGGCGSPSNVFFSISMLASPVYNGHLSTVFRNCT